MTNKKLKEKILDELEDEEMVKCLMCDKKIRKCGCLRVCWDCWKKSGIVGSEK